MSGEQQGSTESHINLDMVVGTCPTVQIFINNIPVMCLVDSGSQVTTVTESFYNKFVSQLQGLIDISAYKKASNGLEIPVCGLLIVSITLEEQLYDDVYILVVKDSVDSQMMARKADVPGIIGCNMLKLLKQSMVSNRLIQESTIVQEMVQLYDALR